MNEIRIRILKQIEPGRAFRCVKSYTGPYLILARSLSPGTCASRLIFKDGGQIDEKFVN